MECDRKMSLDISEDLVLKKFPCPKFRKGQKETLIKMAEAFNSGYKAVLLDAPTGKLV